MNLDRRSFFRVLGALAASTAVPSIATSLLEVAQPVPAGLSQVGLIRELAAYDIQKNLVLVRYDVLARNVQTQLGVDIRIPRREWESLEVMERHRGIVKQLLEDAMRHDGISWSDLEPLPIPSGYLALENISQIEVC